MTDKTPSDAEIEQLCLEETGFDLDESPAALRDFARAVLAKWGPPAQAAEPVAWYEYNGDLDAWFITYSNNPKAKTRQLVFGDTAPKPVAREPLSHEQQIAESLRKFGLTLVKTASGYDVLELGKVVAHGIKGGQHGTE